MFNWSCRQRSIKGRIGKFIIDQYKPWIIENCVSKSGQPFDQTKGNALAQIQIIIRKDFVT
jgi:hypothetical protein